MKVREKKKKIRSQDHWANEAPFLRNCGHYSFTDVMRIFKVSEKDNFRLACDFFFFSAFVFTVEGHRVNYWLFNTAKGSWANSSPLSAFLISVNTQYIRIFCTSLLNWNCVIFCCSSNTLFLYLLLLLYILSVFKILYWCLYMQVLSVLCYCSPNLLLLMCLLLSTFIGVGVYYITAAYSIVVVYYVAVRILLLCKYCYCLHSLLFTSLLSTHCLLFVYIFYAVHMLLMLWCSISGCI